MNIPANLYQDNSSSDGNEFITLVGGIDESAVIRKAIPIYNGCVKVTDPDTSTYLYNLDQKTNNGIQSNFGKQSTFSFSDVITNPVSKDFFKIQGLSTRTIEICEIQIGAIGANRQQDFYFILRSTAGSGGIISQRTPTPHYTYQANGTGVTGSNVCVVTSDQTTLGTLIGVVHVAPVWVPAAGGILQMTTIKFDQPGTFPPIIAPSATNFFCINNNGQALASTNIYLKVIFKVY